MKRAALAVVVAVLAGVGPGTASWGQEAIECSRAPEYLAEVPSPSSELPGWPQRRALTPELNAYVQVVDEASDRVTSGVFGESYGGTPLVYALVGTPANLARVDEIAARQRLLRDPRVTSAAEAAKIAATSPAIVWYTANVHGNETSGADAALHILYDLAARTDCAVRNMLANLVIGIIPTQNPDGRDAFSRTNTYSFDMNRDWFARTQRETDGKLRLLRRYPPVLFVDAHEMSNSSFFFPPNADPIHHEISDEALGWINEIYAPALKKAFQTRQASDPANWDFFNYDVYDLFYMGYGDSVPTTAYTAAGMTFEKGIADTDQQREDEQYVAGWTTLLAASKAKNRILLEHYRAHIDALRDGRAGALEPNEVIAPGNELRRQVPDLTVRNYFFSSRRAGADVRRLIERLLAMDVEVRRLSAPLRVNDLVAYGRAPSARTVPAGSYWIPMAQPQKRWVQAILGADSYTPFPYFYDVTAWSNPLLMNLEAWYSAARVRPRSARVRVLPPAGVRSSSARPEVAWWPGDSSDAVAAAFAAVRDGAKVRRAAEPVRVGEAKVPEGAFMTAASGSIAKLDRLARSYGVSMRAVAGKMPPAPAVGEPRIAVYSPVAAEESLGHLRYLLEQRWKIPYQAVTGVEVAGGALTTGDYDVFIVPGVGTQELLPARAQIQLWIEGGGTYIGTARPGGSGGTAYAGASGWTTSASEGASGLQIPGTIFRVELDGSSPVLAGTPRFTYWYHLGEDVLTPTSSGANLGSFPKSAPDFWHSGYAEGQEVLQGTAALVEEALGAGRIVLFSGEPGFRAYTDAPAFLLTNAIAAFDRGAPEGRDVLAGDLSAAVERARSSYGPAIGPGRPIRIQVSRYDERIAAAVLTDFGATPRLERAARYVTFVVANPSGLDRETHPWSGRVLTALSAAGVTVRSAIL